MYVYLNYCTNDTNVCMCVCMSSFIRLESYVCGGIVVGGRHVPALMHALAVHFVRQHSHFLHFPISLTGNCPDANYSTGKGLRQILEFVFLTIAATPLISVLRTPRRP